MKNLLVKIICVFAFSFSMFGNANAGVPVIDSTNIMQMVWEWAEKLKQYEEHMKKLSEGRGLGSILPTAELDKIYNYDELFNSYMNFQFGAGFNDNNARTIYNSNILFDYCNMVKDRSEKAICEARLKDASQTMSNAQKAIGKIQSRVNNINSLKAIIDNTDDVKSSADLMSRVNAEAAAIENAMGEVGVMLGVAEQQELIRREQEVQLYKKYFSTKNVPQLTPVQW